MSKISFLIWYQSIDLISIIRNEVMEKLQSCEGSPGKDVVKNLSEQKGGLNDWLKPPCRDTIPKPYTMERQTLFKWVQTREDCTYKSTCHKKEQYVAILQTTCIISGWYTHISMIKPTILFWPFLHWFENTKQGGHTDAKGETEYILNGERQMSA